MCYWSFQDFAAYSRVLRFRRVFSSYLWVFPLRRVIVLFWHLCSCRIIDGISIGILVDLYLYCGHVYYIPVCCVCIGVAIACNNVI